MPPLYIIWNCAERRCKKRPNAEFLGRRDCHRLGQSTPPLVARPEPEDQEEGQHRRNIEGRRQPHRIGIGKPQRHRRYDVEQKPEAETDGNGGNGGRVRDGGGAADIMESVATLYDASGRAVGSWPIRSTEFSDGMARGLPNLDQLRLQALARNSAWWIKRYVEA